MRIRRLSIDGYGQFVHWGLELTPGFQVIFGPNEQGKSTIRAFIGDMLYGQKRSAAQRVYEDANELRCPWSNPECYGGRLTYELDDGREIEVFRVFDKKNEQVHVYDRTHAGDITGEFEQLRNREPLFALAHLGLSKEVFLNTATICHLTLDHLGDEEALAQIREKLLALADSGEERSSADATLKRLKARIDLIGAPAARTRPLPAARARLSDLEREYEAAAALRRDLAEADERRREILEDLEGLRRRRAALEDDLARWERIARAERLDEAERITGQIDDVTQQCFALNAVRDFPIDHTPEVLRTDMQFGAARTQCERTRAERAELEQQIADERARLGDAGATDAPDIPDEYDQQLADFAAGIQRIRDRLDDVQTARAGSESRLRAAEEEKASLPDFSCLADDPVAWINQLAGTFRLALRSREEECRKRDALREGVERRRAAIADLEKLFGHCSDFGESAREYEVSARMREEQAAQLKTTIEHLYTTAEEYGERIAGFAKLCLLTTALLVGVLIVAFVTGNPGVYVPAVPAGLAVVFFAVSLLHARAQTQRALTQLEEYRATMQGIWTEDDQKRSAIDQMIIDSECQTLRELEGKYDKYRQARLELSALEAALEEHEAKAAEAEQRVVQLFADLQKSFRAMGEEVQQASDVEGAAGRAVVRYQAYRDAKRRIAENREQIKRHDADAKRLQEDLQAALDAERLCALEVRRRMRENGYPEEGRHDSALIALRSYRIRRAELLKKRGRIDVLREKLVQLDRRIEAEEEDVRTLEATLSRLLAAGKCESVKQWSERAGQARDFQDLRQQITKLQDHLRSVLRGEELPALRAAVEADGPLPERPAQTMDDLKRLLDAVAADTDARMKEEHALHLNLTERAAGIRSLNEIEEDRTVIAARVQALEFELEAASYAMALIDTIARDKHARIAPRLAAIAGGFLREITGGAYDELLINRDMQITVREPHTQRMVENPEKVLSKGTVDQVYLALRLAMIRTLSENGERIPILLDDPFANYDDQRLQSALRLLSRLAEQHQIILFTCREDVVRAAQTVGAAIRTLSD